MSVVDGQDADQTTFNAAFVTKDLNESADGIKTWQKVGKFDLGFAMKAAADASATGTAQDVTLSQPMVILTNASLSSIRNLTIANMAYATIIAIKNGKATGDITFINNSGGTAANRILTGTGADLKLKPGAALFMAYDTVNTKWQVIGGSGGGLDAVGPFAVTDGQAATTLTGEAYDGTATKAVRYIATIVRGTTVFTQVDVSLQYLNSTWRVVVGQSLSNELHGVTFSVAQVSTTGTLKAALDVGAGNGTIDLSKISVSA